ncbi:MAG: M20/M25/M40 family metallo-hydrolase [Clostridia bacterium]|nr:M20/M25/M40 family metallo-hydrolase [Clostridia bacterium]
MKKIKEILNALLSSNTPTGFEFYGNDTIKSLAEGIFDEIKTDSVGNFLLVKKSSKQNAKKLLIDAHYDTVGLMVTGVFKGGFLSVTQLGGLDTSVLPSTEVTVLGKENVYGIITSTPPHLKKGESKSPKMDELYVDTGYSKEKLSELVSIGDPIIYRNKVDYINGDYVTSAYLDDKACLCALIYAASQMDKDKMEFDLYLTASAQEETGKSAVARLTFDLEPDLAVVTDVNFARTEKDDSFDCIEAGKGASFDISAVTDRKITKNIMKYLTSEGVGYQCSCEPSRTSTNADYVSISGNGIPTVLISVPLKSMHTPSETVNLNDIKSLSDVLVKISYNDKILN